MASHSSSVVTGADPAALEVDLKKMHHDFIQSDKATSDLQKARKESENIQRREYLEKAKQFVFASREREAQFWASQDNKFRLLQTRLQSARSSTDDVSTLLKKRAKAHAAAFDLLARDPTSFAGVDSGSLREAAIAFELLRKTSLEDFQTLRDRVFEPTIESAATLASEVSKRAAAFDSTERSLHSDVLSAQERTWQAWSAYERVCGESIRLEREGKPCEKDPVVVGRVYRFELEKLKIANTQYSEKMSRLFDEMKLADGRRIDNTKTLLLDWLLAEKQSLQTQQKMIEQTIAAVKLIDREKDVNDWVRNSQFLINDQGANVWSQLPPNQDKRVLIDLMQRDVVMHGNIGRQGKIFRSSWTNVIGIVTRAGFFHYFDDLSDIEPAFSLNLSDVTVSLAPEHGHCALQLSQPNSSYFSFSSSPNLFVFNASTEESLVDWMVALQTYCVKPQATEPPPRRASVVAATPAPAVAHTVAPASTETAPAEPQKADGGAAEKPVESHVASVASPSEVVQPAAASPAQTVAHDARPPPPPPAGPSSRPVSPAQPETSTSPRQQ